VLCAGLLALALEGPLPLGLLCLLCGASLGGAPALRPHLRGLVLAVLGLMWSTALSQGLFYGEQPRVALLHLGPLVLWREGLWHGLVQSLRFIAVTLAGVSLALRCPSDRLYLGLMGLGIHPGLSFLAATSLRSLPLVAAELASVRGAWASRARPTWHRHPWAWLQVELALLRPALARSLRRARVLAESLDMRGFDPTARRSAWRPLRWGWRDSAALAPALLLTLGILGARGLYLLYVAELYYHPSLRLLLGLVRRWL
jgi:energy-coupling factor transporter transmembrane protein EcfT